MHQEEKAMVEITYGVPVVKCGVDFKQKESHAHVSKVLHFDEPREPVVPLFALRKMGYH